MITTRKKKKIKVKTLQCTTHYWGLQTWHDVVTRKKQKKSALVGNLSIVQ